MEPPQRKPERSNDPCITEGFALRTLVEGKPQIKRLYGKCQLCLVFVLTDVIKWCHLFPTKDPMWQTVSDSRGEGIVGHPCARPVASFSGRFTVKLAIAGDSVGEDLAVALADYLKDRFEVHEISRVNESGDPSYADLAERVASRILDGTYHKAILVCGTGIGVCIAANKVPGIRAALTHDGYSAERAVLSNNAQIITMGARVIGTELAKAIADAFLAQQFDERGRSARNVMAIDELDAKYKVR